MRFRRIVALLALAWLALVATHALAQDVALSEQRFLPGDAVIGSATEIQDHARIAAGGSGYLAVWEDRRAMIIGQAGFYGPLSGNSIDIYASRLDASGQPVDPTPIVVSNEGQSQARPEVAWNGQDWLVAWTTQRPDWYFYQDLMGARVSADGQLLDTTPIPLRLQHDTPANDYASNPSVGTDGTNWVVVWEDLHWVGTSAYPTISAVRVAPDGTVLDSPPIILHENNLQSFGPIKPQIVKAGEVLFLVWEQSGYQDIKFRRYNLALQPIDAQPITVTTNGESPRVATNGSDIFVVARRTMGYRVTDAGQVLDPSGISFNVPGNNDRGADVAWDGSAWCVSISSSTENPHDLADTYFLRIGTNGTILAPGPAPLEPSASDQYKPALASMGEGSVEVIWSERNLAAQVLDGIRGVHWQNGIADPGTWVSVGLNRQTYVRSGRNGGELMNVYMSQGNGSAHLLAQRLDSWGQAIDAEPNIVATFDENRVVQADVAWDGSVYLVVWVLNNSVYGRRLAADGTPIDAAPVIILTDQVSLTPAISGLDGVFYLAYSHIISGDNSFLKGVRVRGQDLAVLGTPSTLGSNYAQNPRIETIGGRWLVVWERQANHDLSSSWIFGIFIDPVNGQPGDLLPISQDGYGDRPDVAVVGDRALVVWWDDIDTGRIEGRLLDGAGSFIAGEFLVADNPGKQLFASVGSDGERFIAAWIDYESVEGVEQMRGDVRASRIAVDGSVLDPGGIALTSGPLPEDLPEVAGAEGRSIVLYSMLHGVGSPEVQRIGYRVLWANTASAGDPLLNGRVGLCVGPNPFQDGVVVQISRARAAGPIRVAVIAADGRRVRAADLPAGISAWRWDGLNDRGGSLPSGVYYLRLTAEGKSIGQARIVKAR